MNNLKMKFIKHLNNNKTIKYLIINLQKKYKIIHEYYKTLKEIKDDLSKWKFTSHSWLRRLNIVKMSIILNCSIDST